MAKSSARQSLPDPDWSITSHRGGQHSKQVPESGRLAIPEKQKSKVQTKLLGDWLDVPFKIEELRAVKLVEENRPPALRSYDQIPMKSTDLLRQAKLIGPYIKDKSVAFMGDADCASLLLGLLNTHGAPSRMTLLDFDERLLEVAYNFAYHHGFGDLLYTRLYNVSDAIPISLLQGHDWFYTNPPYGSNNAGASARLFIARGLELTKPGGKGCIILPYDEERAWTREAMLSTQDFLIAQGWAVSEKLNQQHRYILDDDEHLSSSILLVDDIENCAKNTDSNPYWGRRVDLTEIPYFYGRSTEPPYPRYIRKDGSWDEDWSN